MSVRQPSQRFAEAEAGTSLIGRFGPLLVSVQWSVVRWMAALLTVSFGVQMDLQADEFLLRDGRKIIGTVKSTRDKQLVVELAPGTLILLDQAEIKQHKAPSKSDVAYSEAMKSVEDTVEFHLKMASLAQRNGLVDHVRAHYERVLDLDSGNRAARLGLGYVENDDGRWILRDELMTEGRGKVSVGGSKYRFPELIAMEEAEKKANDQRIQLVADIRRALNNLKNPRLSADAMAKLQGLDGPFASAAMAEIMFPRSSIGRKDALSDEIKAAFVESWERLADAAAVSALIRLCLAPEGTREAEELRQRSVQALRQIAPHAAVTSFLAALRYNPLAPDSTAEIARINLAARLLEQLGDERAILPLIEVVVTNHRKKISSGSSATNVGFGNGQGGMSFGESVRMQDFASQNPAVLSALVSLTSQNYSYEKTAWLGWYHEQYVEFSGDLRRDP